MICPCCGQEVTPKGRLQAFAARQSPIVQGPVIRALMQATRPLSAAELVDRVYANNPSGGPDGATKSIHIAVHRLKPKLRDIGWMIEWQGWAGYTLRQVAA
jgi:hypothetical protein